MRFELEDIRCGCCCIAGIFSGINKFDLQRSSATKIKSKVVGIFFWPSVYLASMVVKI